jgi:replicative DNA helicase
MLTGIRGYDKITNGLREGELVLVVGDAKSGKTAFGATLALQTLLTEEAAGRDCATLVANREVQADRQSARLDSLVMWMDTRMRECLQEGDLAAHPHVDTSLTQRIELAKLHKGERTIYKDALRGVSQWKNKLWMVDVRAYQTIEQLETIIAGVKRKSPLRLVFIDALNDQRLSKTWASGRNWETQGELARTVERIARDHRVCVVAEVQENTQTVTRREVGVHELFALASEFGKAASQVVRLFKVPNDPLLVEGQMVASRFTASKRSWPMLFSPGDMYVADAPPGMDSRIAGLCAAGANGNQGRRR